MPTNATRTKGDIQTNQVISIEAADSNHPMSPAGTSTEVEILAEIYATNNVVERKQGMSDKVSEAKSELFLDRLRLDVTDTIIVMVGRMWDVSAVTGRYLSTDFVVSNAKSITFHYKVTIDGVRTRKGWNLPSCGSDTSKKSVTRQNDQFFCETCNKTVDYPVVAVMFNETTTALVKCSADSLMDTIDEYAKDHLILPPALSNIIGTDHVMEIKSHTYYEYGTFESFTCWQIHPSKGIKDNVGSSSLDAVTDNQPHKLKSLTRNPSIATPSKLAEERKNLRMDVEDSDTEDSGDSANVKGKKEALQPFDKKKKNQVEFDDSDANVRCGSGRVGGKGTTATYSAKEKRKRYTHIPFRLAD
ncbi:nucleic acid-binding, OB-fold protein [Tanacetum coccineum]